MITEESVFILGAGSSNPYGYPTGRELRERIIKDFLSWVKKAYSDNRNAEEQAKEFVEVFNMSSNSSVDLFLSRNKKFNDYGKLAIVSTIASAERKSVFRAGMGKRQGEDWYSYIFLRNDFGC